MGSRSVTFSAQVDFSHARMRMTANSGLSTKPSVRVDMRKSVWLNAGTGMVIIIIIAM